MRDATQWGVECLLRQFPKARITVEPIDTLAHSEVSRIRVADAIERSYIVKSGTHPLMYREFVFYRELSPLLPDEICPRCFFSVELDGVYAVLLEDVEGSPIEVNAYPSEARVEQFVIALTKLHRHSQTIFSFLDWPVCSCFSRLTGSLL